MRLSAKLFIFIMIIMFPQSQVSAKTVRMAVFILAPYMMQENAASEKNVGITIDYWKEFIAPEMGVDFEIACFYPIFRTLKMLKDGEVDVVSQFTKTPERETEFLYPETPLTSVIPCLVVLKDSPLKEVNKSEELFGMTLGFIKESHIPEMVKHEKIKLDLLTGANFRELNYNKLQQ